MADDPKPELLFENLNEAAKVYSLTPILAHSVSQPDSSNQRHPGVLISGSFFLSKLAILVPFRDDEPVLYTQAPKNGDQVSNSVLDPIWAPDDCKVGAAVL